MKSCAMPKVKDYAPPRTTDVNAWIEENLAEQEHRHAAIIAAMDALSSERDRWIAEFFERLGTTGYNVNGDQKRRVSADELPKKPARQHKVTY